MGTRLFVRATILVGIAMLCDSAMGQINRRYNNRYSPGRYMPTRPTISPYLDLMRINTGVLPNYQTFVRPKIEQYQTNRVLSQNIAQVQQQTRMLEQNAGMVEPNVGPISIRPTNALPTGVHGQFQYYSHFYPIGPQLVPE